MDKNIESENAEKQQQLAILEEDDDGISVPNWLIDVLKWTPGIEMANSSLSFSCKLFNRLCYPKLHENVEPHFVPFLKFCFGPNKFGDICAKLKNKEDQIIPIASTCPPAEYIRGFGTIIIGFLDTEIIEFVKNIALKQTNLSININNSMQKLQKIDAQFMLMRNLLSILANNIYKLKIFNNLVTNCFLDFDRLFSTFIIDQVPYLKVENIIDLDLDPLFNWLIKPLTDGRQKILRYYFHFDQLERSKEMELRFINRIREEFLHSTEKKNFLVELWHEYGKCSLQNKKTGEMLNLYHKMNPDGYFRILLARYPKEEEHWKKGNDEKIFGKRNTHIHSIGY